MKHCACVRACHAVHTNAISILFNCRTFICFYILYVSSVSVWLCLSIFITRRNCKMNAMKRKRLLSVSSRMIYSGEICRHSLFFFLFLYLSLSLPFSLSLPPSLLAAVYACMSQNHFFSFVYISHNRSICFMNLVFSDAFVISSMLEVTGMLVITMKPVYGLFLLTPFNISQ